VQATKINLHALADQGAISSVDHLPNKRQTGYDP